MPAMPAANSGRTKAWTTIRIARICVLVVPLFVVACGKKHDAKQPGHHKKQPQQQQQHAAPPHNNNHNGKHPHGGGEQPGKNHDNKGPHDAAKHDAGAPLTADAGSSSTAADAGPIEVFTP